MHVHLQVDDEMEKHNQLLKEVQDSPLDINAIVAKRRKDFTGDFFRHLTLLAETYDGLEDRDGNMPYHLTPHPPHSKLRFSCVTFLFD